MFVAGLLCCIAPAMANAQTTASGSLVVAMTVQSSISLVFVNGSGAGTQGTCSITGANTSTASVNFGIASIAGDNQSCVSFSVGGTTYTLSNNLYLQVSQTNLSSNNFTLVGSLGAAPATGVTWTINSATLSTSSTTLTSYGTYGSNFAMYLQVVVHNTAPSGNIGEVLNFTATAN